MFNGKMIDFVKKLVWKSENKYFAKVLRNRLQIGDGPDFKYENVGEFYTKAMFSPVSAIMMKLYDIYGTTNLPIYGIKTNIGDVKFDTLDTVVITIQTSQPGIFRGSHSTDLEGVMMPNAKNYTELIEKAMKELFVGQPIDVIIEEVPAIQVVDF